MKHASNRRALESARRRREALEIALGGVCRKCGAHERLEFHHTHGRTWIARAVAQWTRIRLYERDAAAGLLVLLCRTCHRQEP